MPIILTISCAKDRLAGQQAVRETWRHLSQGWCFDHKFLLGRGNTDEQSDEWIVDAPDDYAGVLEKLRCAYRRADEYDFTFVSCIDTYIVPVRLQQTGFRRHNFSGAKCATEAHASGGNGYWLSRRARQHLADSPILRLWPYADQEDSQVLFMADIPLHDDQRYGVSVTKHLSRTTGVYDPQWMYDLHRKFMEQPL